ncbi:DUF1800 domain-containing protein [Yoonia sp. BS5-3]|uniref:DUF1800 domain-containing protein n=1 Tax=Yoonia phaeophyticola TaxID=3137369 RepID=A0ABZ2V6Q3_9RHOB
MKITRSRLLTVTPLILAAVSNGAAAQEAASASSLLIQNAQTVNADTAQGATTIPLQITIPDDGTYVFSAPAISGIQLIVGGQSLFGSSVSSSDETVKALMSMTAGTFDVEVSGEGLTLAALADVTANLLGMPEASIVSIASTGETSVSSSFSARVASSSVADAVTDATASTSVLTEVSTASTNVRTTATSEAAVVNNIITVPSPGDNDRENVGGILRNTIRDAITVAIANDPVSGGGGGTVVVGDGEAQSSMLSPPTGVTLIEAVEIVGGATDEGVVASSGQTMFGAVMDPTTYDAVVVTIEPSGRTETVDVGPTTGQFAFRLFPEDLATGAASVSVMGVDSADATIATAPVTYDYTSGVVADGLTVALSRLTYGPTVDLYSRVRGMGFENYVNEQLSPGSIRDAAFDAMDVDQLVEDLTNSFSGMQRREMAHRIAWAAYSDKQLQEVMGDFWSNHFFASTKNTRIYLQNVIDRQYYRDNAFGDFEDLLLYSARSPLMSQFLDNDQSRVGNINENYGREILELHTVGVDGGYGDEDVIAVSRIFTGWLYERTNPNEDTLAQEFAFTFESDRHDTDDKLIPFLNTTITGRTGAAGVQEGEELIAMLADDPRTHEYVCGKIVQRFVADVPPAEFVEICTTTWADTDGDMREVLRDILLAPAYLEGAADRGTKSKTPYEYSIAVMRALGVDIEPSDGFGIFRRFENISTDGGYDALTFGLPTGLDEVGDAWTNSASMLGVYREATEVAELTNTYDIDLGAMTEEAGLETAEEVAAFLLTIATADDYTLEEYEAMVTVLKGEDGIFEPLTSNESSAFEQAGGLMIVLPSFYIQ